MAPLGPMMDFRVWVRPAWSGAAKSGTRSPTAGPVLIWPQRADAKTASHGVLRMIFRIVAWAGSGPGETGRPGLPDFHHLDDALLCDRWNRRVGGSETDRDQHKRPLVLRPVENTGEKSHRARS